MPPATWLPPSHDAQAEPGWQPGRRRRGEPGSPAPRRPDQHGWRPEPPSAAEDDETQDADTDRDSFRGRLRELVTLFKDEATDEEERAWGADPASYDTPRRSRGRREGRASTLRRKRQQRRRVLTYAGAGGGALLLALVTYLVWPSGRPSAPTATAGAALHEAVSPVTGLYTQHSSAAVNILIIGPAAGAGAGNATPSGANDAMALLHLSADHSNATIVSIPPTTVGSIPSCRNASGVVVEGGQNPIGTAMTAGPGCEVDTVETLTHVPIDGFVELDGNGLVDLSDVIGAVPVCSLAQRPAGDDSGLEKPTSAGTVKGSSALAFLGDGTSGHGQALGAALLTALHGKSASDIEQLAAGAGAALTTSANLADSASLGRLVAELANVSPERVTFVTLPTQTYLPDAAYLSPSQQPDDQLFQLISADTSLSASTTSASATPSVPPASPGGVSGLVVANGTDAQGRAGQVAATLRSAGFDSVGSTDYTDDTETRTLVHYATGQLAAAEAVAAALHLPSDALVAGDTGGDSVLLVIGADYTSGTYYSAPAAASGTSLPADLASAASPETAAALQGC